MATVVSNNRIGSRLQRDVAPIDTSVSSGTIYAGDMVYITGNSPNGVASLNNHGSDNANAATFCGVSRDAYPIPFSDGLTETVSSPTVSFDREGFFRFHGKSGDSFAPGDLVYFSAASTATALQEVTVTSTNAGDSVGVVAWDQTPVGGTVGGTITGAAGQDIIIYITPTA